jgi:outer membrane protein assembly factor BamB
MGIIACSAAVTLILAIAGFTVLVRQTGTKTTTTLKPSTTPTASVIPTPSPTALPAGNDWTMYRYDDTGTGVNPEGTITTANVAQLTMRWSNPNVYGFPPIESTPAELDGVVYFTAGHSLHALNLATGKEFWVYSDTFASKESGTLFSSVAIDPQTRIAYYGSGDGRLYAVDTRTGKGVWNALLGEPSVGSFTWSSPLLVNGKVYLGIASHDNQPCVRGGLFALDPATGVTIWSHYTVPDGRLGGSVWSSLTADPDAHQIIATTATPCDLPQGAMGGYTDAEQDAIVGIDWNSGATIWKFTALKYDDCDCDFGEGAVIFTYQGTKYVAAGNKYGDEYGLISPTTPGDSPKVAWTDLISQTGYLGSGGIYEPPTYSDGVIYVASGSTPDGECPRGAVWALRADTGATVWRQCTAYQVVSASMLTGGVLFVPQQNQLVAYSAATGHVLWKASQPGAAWGGVSLARGFVLSASVAGTIYCYGLPSGG